MSTVLSCPQVSRRKAAGGRSLSGWRDQWLRTATSARQSATRFELSEVSDTKVPLEQSSGFRSGTAGLFWAGEFTGGMGPVSWLPSRLSSVRLVSWESSAGMGPVSWLPLRLSSVRLVSWESSAGMGPVSWLPLRLSSVRLVSWESSAGIGPLILRSGRERAFTLLGLR